MLDHLSHAFYTFPVFGLVGMKDRNIRPAAVKDVAGVIVACLVEGRLSKKTVAVTGPEEMTLREAVERVAEARGRRPVMVRMPVVFLCALAWVAEGVMKVPLLSVAQARILSEGLVEASGECEELPEDLTPRTRFTREVIVRGLPEAGAFRMRDCRWCWR